MKKKIGFLMVDSLPMPPVMGGAVENLVQLLIDNNEDNNKFEFHIYSLYDSKVESVNTGFKNTTYHYYKQKGISTIIAFVIRVIRYICRHHLNIYMPSLYELQAKRLFKKLGIRTIVLENCPYSAIYMNKGNEFYLIQHLHNDYLYEHTKLIDQLLSRSQKFLAVSHFIKDRLLLITPQHIPVEICHNGLELSKYDVVTTEDELDELKSKYGIERTDKVVTFIGRITRNKGVKELMLAFEKLLVKQKNMKLLIVGGQSFSKNTKDSYAKELDEIATRLSSKVVFTGYVDYSEIYKYHQLSTMIAVPSTCYESFSLSTLESLASGVPVLISDAGGMLEVIDDKCGLIAHRGDNFIEEISNAIETICFNGLLYSEMCKAAKKRSQIFTDKSMYNSFIRSL
ncbi:glycosyltransferase family 4 protein [Bacteroides fragilis]